MSRTRNVPPKSRAAWRQWLAKNWDSADEVTLVYYKKHTGKAGALLRRLRRGSDLLRLDRRCQTEDRRRALLASFLPASP